MAATWSIEGAWFKNCNCDPGCPCDFNADPTHGYCEGIIAMRVDKGHFGEVPLDGVRFAGVVHWDGPIHQGNGHVQPIVDEAATEEQREAILTILSGQAGDTLMEIMSAMTPNVHEPIFAPIEFEFDIERRTGRVRAGDVLESDVDTLRGIGSDEPYRILVRIPEGFEYTGDNQEAETALARRIRFDGAIKLDISDGHSSMAYVRHSGEVPVAA